MCAVHVQFEENAKNGSREDCLRTLIRTEYNWRQLWTRCLIVSISLPISSILSQSYENDSNEKISIVSVVWLTDFILFYSSLQKPVKYTFSTWFQQLAKSIGLLAVF